MRSGSCSAQRPQPTHGRSVWSDRRVRKAACFPLIAGLIIMATGIVLLMRPSTRATGPEAPARAALGRILGVVAGLAVMALGIPYLRFAVTGAITMIILLRTVEETSWAASIVLALCSVVAVIWLFGHVLGMALPRGPWGL